MDFEAIVHLVLPAVTGEGARGQWTKQEVIFEVANNEYGRKICVGFWNDKAASAAALRVGERVMVSVNIESRERNGRWFTEARGWKFTILNPNAAAPAPQPYAQPQYGQQTYGQQQPYAQPQQQPYAQPAPQPAAEPAAAPSMVDDLPF
ncbi:MAG: DUF3127 domain-containing protein [Rikenellaceae bacterium]